MTERETGRALGISINAQVDQGRVIVFQTHVDVDTDAKALDELLDKLNIAADRQAAFYELPLLQKSIRVEKDRLHAMETGYADMERRRAIVNEANTGRRKAPELTAKEEIDKTNAADQIRRQREIVAEVEANLKTTAEKAGQRHGGVASAANS